MEPQYQIEGHSIDCKGAWHILCDPIDIVECQEKLLYILSAHIKAIAPEACIYDSYRIIKIKTEIYSVWNLYTPNY